MSSNSALAIIWMDGLDVVFGARAVLHGLIPWRSFDIGFCNSYLPLGCCRCFHMLCIMVLEFILAIKFDVADTVRWRAMVRIMEHSPLAIRIMWTC